MNNKVKTRILFLFLVISAWSGVSASAQGRIGGTVTDAKGEPVVGAVVMLENNTSIASTTDFDGRYSLVIPASVRHPKLKASCIGYNEKSMDAEGKTKVDFVLEENAEELDEVVVVGYGSMRRSDLTGSVASVRIDEDEASRSTNIGQLLQGQASGVQVVNNGGAPDGGISILVRGASSFNGSSQPLYVVDGVIISGSSSSHKMLTVGTSSDSDDTVNGLMGLNPQDIASIEILKDASATAIYGSQGANGVVLITTKTANRERPVIRFNSGVDISQVSKKADILSFDEYSDYVYTKLQMGVAGARTAMEAMYEDADNRTGLKVYPMDWQDLAMRTAVSQRYFFSIAGKPKSTSYSYSLGYSDREGIIRTTSVKQYTMRLNLDRTVGKRFRFGTKTNLAYIDSDMTQATSGGSLVAATSLIRSILMFRPYSGYNLDEEFEDEEGNLQSSPLRWLDRRNFVNNRQEYRITPSLYAEYKIAPWLTFRSTLGGDYRNAEYQKFKSALINTSAEGTDAATGTFESLYWNMDNLLMFNKTIGAHNLSGTLGSSIDKRFSTEERVQGWGIDQYKAGVYAINAAPYTGLSYYENQSQRASFFIRAIYSFQDRYVLTATFREDGSSKFREGNKWAAFPSFAFAWRINQEPWFRIPAVSMAKLRFGWGRVGNQDIGTRLTLSNYGSSHIPTHDVGNPSESTVSLYPSNIANPDLKWETTEQLNAGLDLSLWKGRVALTVDAYRKMTYDLLQSKTIPSSTGFSSVYVNEGDIENKGLEFTLDLVPVKTSSLEWTLSGNISFNRSKIVKISDTADSKQIFVTPDHAEEVVYFYGSSLGTSNYVSYPGNIFMEGYPMALFYGWKVKGIVREGQAGTPLAEGSDERQPGYIDYYDLNGNGYIDDEDRTIIGDPNPDFIYGFRTTVTWKSLSLSAGFNGSYGNDIINMNKAVETYTAATSTNVLRDAFYKAWTPERQETDYPALGSITTADSKKVSSWYIEDGSYLRLANLSLSWNAPVKKNARVLKGLALTASANNLHVWTRYSGWDPDVNSFGTNIRKLGCDSGSYPASRTFSFDVKFTF